MSCKGSALVYAWEGDKLVGVAMDCQMIADCFTPTKFDEEIVRIFNENNALKKMVIELRGEAGFYSSFQDKNQLRDELEIELQNLK